MIEYIKKIQSKPEEERKKGAICWQFSVFIPIDLNNVKRLNFFNVRWKKFLKHLQKLNTKLHGKHWLYTVLANRFNVCTTFYLHNYVKKHNFRNNCRQKSNNIEK